MAETGVFDKRLLVFDRAWLSNEFRSVASVVGQY